MPLYLVRHAHAVTAEENPARPLSPRGRDDLRRLSLFFRANRAFLPALVWHSPLVRARETAELLVSGIGLESPLLETPGLLSEDDPEEISARLGGRPATQNLALVGHEPHLSALATLLVRGKESPAAFEMKKGAVLALERTDDIHKKSGEIRWRVSWLVVPALIPEMPDNEVES
jgi:phosphohistidine phosphatase